MSSCRRIGSRAPTSRRLSPVDSTIANSSTRANTIFVHGCHGISTNGKHRAFGRTSNMYNVHYKGLTRRLPFVVVSGPIRSPRKGNPRRRMVAHNGAAAMRRCSARSRWMVGTQENRPNSSDQVCRTPDRAKPWGAWILLEDFHMLRK